MHGRTWLSPPTQRAHHLVKEQTHQHKQRPQHKGLSQQQPPWDWRTMIIGFPTYSVMADHPPAMPARSPHAMPHKAMLCLPQTLGRGELRSRCCLWVCYTAHTYLPLYAPSSGVALLAIIWI